MNTRPMHAIAAIVPCRNQKRSGVQGRVARNIGWDGSGVCAQISPARSAAAVAGILKVEGRAVGVAGISPTGRPARKARWVKHRLENKYGRFEPCRTRFACLQPSVRTDLALLLLLTTTRRETEAEKAKAEQAHGRGLGNGRDRSIARGGPFRVGVTSSRIAR